VARGQYDSKDNDDKLRDEAVKNYFARNEMTEQKREWLIRHKFLQP
jgi:hypothetical protein